MLKASLEAIVSGLNEAGVRYLIVGGLAVNAHGYMRTTVDVDLVIQLDEENVKRGLAVFKSLGYQPRVPVSIDSFADAETRKSWITDKHMQVFSLNSPQHPETEVDVFTTEPFGFERAYGERIPFELTPDIMAPVCSLADLIQLKRDAGRLKDQLDLEKLKDIHEP